MLLPFVVAAAVFAIALDGGSYGVVSRSGVAIAVWWTIALGVALGRWPSTTLPRAAVVVGTAFAALAAWTAASITWAPSAEDAFREFDRVMLYGGVYALAVLAATRRTVAAWSNGLALGITATVAVALGTRFFPSAFPESDLSHLMPTAATRLSYPLNYWNGLGIFSALALPLLMRAAVAGRTATARGLAVTPVPAIIAALYLTSSRTGVIAALVGIGVFVTLTTERWAAVAAAVVAGAGSVAAVAILLARPELVDAPLGSAGAAQGRGAAALLALVCAAVGVTYGVGVGLLRGRVRIPRVIGWAAAAVAVAFSLAGVAAADPAERYEDFKRVPEGWTEAGASDGGYVRAHLTSATGNGRWQLWRAAVEQFESSPLAGHGAASFEPWWAKHGALASFSTEAHSLYFEILGELGVVGFAFLAIAFAGGLIAGVRRLLASRAQERTTIAALLACFVAFALAAGVDWMWEMPVVAIAGATCLGLLVGPATRAIRAPAVEPPRRRALLPRVAVPVVAGLIVVSQAVPALAALEVEASQEAVAAGAIEDGADHARNATRIEPWASTPLLQLALVYERQGRLPASRTAVRDAITRDASNWRLWVVAARIETKAGRIAAARRSLARAKELNPRSSLFIEG